MAAQRLRLPRTPWSCPRSCATWCASARTAGPIPLHASLYMYYTRSLAAGYAGVRKATQICRVQQLYALPGPVLRRGDFHHNSCHYFPFGWQVAVLDAPNPAAPGGRTTVYVLGMSHVSRRSCQDTEELVGLVRPDIVLVELCKDRVTGLITSEQVSKAASATARDFATGDIADQCSQCRTGMRSDWSHFLLNRVLNDKLENSILAQAQSKSLVF